MKLQTIELTGMGIRLIAPNGDTIHLGGKDAWVLLNWLNTHAVELWQRSEKADTRVGESDHHQGEELTPPS